MWNTTDLARTIAFVRERGGQVPDKLLAHVAPVKWDHIALTGDDLWSETEKPPKRFRPLRVSRFDPVRFRFA